MPAGICTSSGEIGFGLSQINQQDRVLGDAAPMDRPYTIADTDDSKPGLVCDVLTSGCNLPVE